MSPRPSPLSPYLDRFRALNQIIEHSEEDRLLKLLAGERMNDAWNKLFANDKGPKSPLEIRLHGLLQGVFHAKAVTDALDTSEIRLQKAKCERDEILNAVNRIKRFYIDNRLSATWQLQPCLDNTAADAESHFALAVASAEPGFYSSIKRGAATCFSVNLGMWVHTYFGDGGDGFHYGFTALATNVILNMGPDDLISEADVRGSLDRERKRRLSAAKAQSNA